MMEEYNEKKGGEVREERRGYHHREVGSVGKEAVEEE